MGRAEACDMNLLACESGSVRQPRTVKLGKPYLTSSLRANQTAMYCEADEFCRKPANHQIYRQYSPREASALA
ncbi:hypothetical protein GCM10020360_14820 [Nonlabens tegetincola]